MNPRPVRGFFFAHEMMLPELRMFPGKRLTGYSTRMSFFNNMTASLWQRLMPRRNSIKGRVGTELYSLEVFDPGHFQSFSPAREFQKWATVEIGHDVGIPDGMEELIVPPGNYAVFIHRGPASQGEKTYRYIFQDWLPRSGYAVDERPHFAVMGAKYKHEAEESEEEIWVPVRKTV